MKKLFLIIIAFVGIIAAANVNTGNTGTTPSTPKDSTVSAKVIISQKAGARPQKGVIMLSTKDSTANYLKSDSLLYAQAYDNTTTVDGFKPKQWAR